MKLSLLNEVFYSECALCLKPCGFFEYICPECFKSGVKKVEYLCESCGYPLEVTTAFCRNCSENKNYNKLFIPCWYTGIVRKAVKGLKFNFGLSERSLIRNVVFNYLQVNQKLMGNYDIVTCVPSNFSRRFTRFIMLPEFISQCISQFTGIRYNKLLKKNKTTKYQYKLSKKERIKNVKGAFLCKRDVLGLKILLVDDIMTTGSTLNECSAALIKKGAESVDCFALAKGHFR